VPDATLLRDVTSYSADRKSVGRGGPTVWRATTDDDVSTRAVDGPRLPSVDEPDPGVVARAADGDAKAARELVERYERLVYSIAWKMCGDPQDADDIAQEAFLRVFRGLPGFRQEARLSTWIFRVTVSAALDYRRREERRAEPPEAGAIAPRLAPGTDVTFDQFEQCRAVLDAMAGLGPAVRRPLVLREVYGLRYEEIGTLLGRPVGTVKAAVHRGRAALLRLLDGRTQGR
jgi:RNA polymerase sigma-70 factor (ECF subfamily)